MLDMTLMACTFFAKKGNNLIMRHKAADLRLSLQTRDVDCATTISH